MPSLKKLVRPLDWNSLERQLRRFLACFRSLESFKVGAIDVYSGNLAFKLGGKLWDLQSLMLGLPQLAPEQLASKGPTVTVCECLDARVAQARSSFHVGVSKNLGGPNIDPN